MASAIVHANSSFSVEVPSRSNSKPSPKAKRIRVHRWQRPACRSNVKSEPIGYVIAVARLQIGKHLASSPVPDIPSAVFDAALGWHRKIALSIYPIPSSAS